MFKRLRILVLLVILATVAQEAWLARTRSASWRTSLQVAVYPINGDGSAAAANYIASLDADSFDSVEAFFDEEARRHGRDIYRPVEVALAPPLADQPPPPPENASRLQSVLWSLRMRFWAWRHDEVPGMKPQVRLFVRYYDPDDHARLPHSVGVRKGMLGLVNAYASRGMAGSNAVILSHELLHTLGATDKYDLASNQPLYPQGYAEPERQPRYPQNYAEIMGGRIPRSPDQADIPKGLGQTLIGEATAAEIGWRDPS